MGSWPGPAAAAPLLTAMLERRGREGGGGSEGGPQKVESTARRQQVREDHEGPCMTRRARWRRHPSRGPREEETARLVS